MTTVGPARTRRLVQPVSTRTRLRLLDTFELICDGAPITLPTSAQRLVAFLALHDRPLLRSYVAGTLWPETLEERAYANLRSTLWRIHRCNLGLVLADLQQLRLDADVEVDLRTIERLARRALVDSSSDTSAITPLTLAGDLLPGWYEDWVLIERELHRQLRLRALDALCERLTDAGRLGEALEVALAALAAEPLRESAHRAIIRVHLAEGNLSEAIRQYRLCSRLLAEHLGVEPSRQTAELMGAVTLGETPA